jgi:hypothetical protein
VSRDRRLRIVVLHASGRENATLAYQQGWPAALARHASFETTMFNLAQRRARIAFRYASRSLLNRADAIVLLHSIFSNERVLPPDLTERVAGARPPKVLFLGNEYKLMPDKMAFAEAVDLSLLVSQLSSPAAHDLYRARLGCAVVGIPNAGFDPARFTPGPPVSQRPIDIGYRAFPSPLYLGHDERRELADLVGEAARRRGLVTDISLARSDRFGEKGWADFLGRCRCQLGSEAGADFFEVTDETRLEVDAYLKEHPDASLAEIRSRFFDKRAVAVSGRALSGRVVEAAATKTVQILLDGDYGGFFEPDVHYLALHKDYANLDGVLDRLRDEAHCTALVEAAYEVARSELTYERLGDRLHDALLPIVRA